MQTQKKHPWQRATLVTSQVQNEESYHLYPNCLYYVLLPVLVLLIVLTFIFYKRWKNQAINMYLEPSRNIVSKKGKVEK